MTLRTIIKKYHSLLKIEYNNYVMVEHLSIPVKPVIIIKFISKSYVSLEYILILCTLF